MQLFTAFPLFALLFQALIHRGNAQESVYPLGFEEVEYFSCLAGSKCYSASATLEIPATIKFQLFKPAGENCVDEYYLFKVKKTWQEAADQCCSFGMRLAVLNTLQKQRCYYQDKATFKGEQSWLGGSAGVGHVQWCGVDEHVVDSLGMYTFFEIQPNRCVMHWASRPEYFAVMLERCTSKFNFICQKTRPQLPRCPEESCVPDSFEVARVQTQLSKMDSINSNYVDDDLTFMKACNKTFVFTFETSSWFASARTCCKLGLKPLVFDTPDAWQCLMSSVANGVFSDFGLFWTPGVFNHNTSKLTWCVDGKEKATVADDLWLLNESKNPSLDDTCVALSLHRNLDNPNGFQSTPCGAQLPVICTKP